MMQSECGCLGFAEDVSKVMVFLGHTREVGGINRGEADAEWSFASSVQIYSVKFIAPGSLQH